MKIVKSEIISTKGGIYGQDSGFHWRRSLPRSLKLLITRRRLMLPDFESSRDNLEISEEEIKKNISEAI